MPRQPFPHVHAWVEIDLQAVRKNAAALAAHAGVPLLPMVKADAYGLGAEQVAHALQSVNPWGFGVATIAEGEALREAGIDRRIVVFTPTLPADFARLRRSSLTPALGDADAIEQWVAGEGTWHLAIDTGMNRAGMRWDAVAGHRDLFTRCVPEGAFTHFYSAERDDGSMEAQERRFDEAVASLVARPRLLHASNSAAILRRERSRYDLVRPGVFLYGGGTGPGAALEPTPVAALRSQIVQIRELSEGDTVSYGATFTARERRRIATVSVGYADGYRRVLGNRASVLVGGRRAPVVGVVTMDMTLIDVTPLDCAVGDVVTLLGRDGDEQITIDDLATMAETISYEMLVGLRLRAHRVPRLDA